MQKEVIKVRKNSKMKFSIHEVVIYKGKEKRSGNVILSPGARVSVTCTFNQYYYVELDCEHFQCTEEELERGVRR